MNSLVVFGSRSGNTQKVAEAIAGALRAKGAVQLVAVDEAKDLIPPGMDLVVVGGPTEAHSVTPPVARFFERLQPGALAGVSVAAFDTRLKAARWLSGSAAVGIDRKLRRAGGLPIGSPESFFVAGKEPELLPGELERAASWGAVLAAKASLKTPVPV